MKELSTIAGTAAGGNFHGTVFDMILASGLMVQFVLALLLIFSIVSWAIIFLKYFQFRTAQKENESFMEIYAKTTKIADLFALSKKYRNSTVAEVFRTGYGELQKIVKAAKDAPAKETVEAGLANLEIRTIDQLERAMNRACDSETSKLERSLGFLATTGSACPFIGLFGTVWGIMNTFQNIGARGSATLAIVAPGISEALIATAAGLAAAIPAVIFYNHYLHRVKTIAMEMDNFSAEFLNIVERHQAKK